MSNNQIDANGIHIQNYSDIVNALINGANGVPGYIQIYGADINVNSNSPDGQMINIYALAKQDMLQLNVQTYNSFNPDAAIGTSLDSISQLCGITRQGGTYTQVAIDIIVSQVLNLNGQDTSTPYTISDSSGNQFQLILSASLGIGTNTLTFQAVNIGFVQVTPNTLNIPVTIISGVTSVNNPAAPIVTGQDQETDAAFRTRRQISVATPAQGVLGGLIGGLYAVTNLTQAIVYENVSSTTNGDGVPAHAIWVITNGGTTADIANVIYKYRNFGCNMYGYTTYNVTQVDGTSFQIKFDVAINQNLYIHMTVHSLLPGGSVDSPAIKSYLVANYILGIYETADITTITALMKAQFPQLVITICLVSGDNSSFVDYVSPSDKKHIFVLSTANIVVSVI